MCGIQGQAAFEELFYDRVQEYGPALAQTASNPMGLATCFSKRLSSTPNIVLMSFARSLFHKRLLAGIEYANGLANILRQRA